MKAKVFEILKPKVVQYGFSSEAVQSVANTISTELQEDATDEDINARIDAVIPFFRISQSEVTRIVNKSKVEEPKPANTPAEDVVDEDVQNEEPEDKFDKVVGMIEKLSGRLDMLANKEVSKTRKQIYADKIKELPEPLRKSMERKFDRISFKDNDDFNLFLEEEVSEIPELLKTHSEEKLVASGRPRVGGRTSGKQASDKEVDNIINQLNI